MEVRCKRHPDAGNNLGFCPSVVGFFVNNATVVRDVLEVRVAVIRSHGKA